MKLWNGRFRTKLDPTALKFSSSLDVDKRLFREDIEGSLAHVAMLARRKIIPAGDAQKIRKALKQILQEMEAGKFPHAGSTNGRFVAEDIHMAIEQRLMEKIGEAGGRLHTARSRNDQIALDERLWLRSTVAGMTKNIRRLQKALIAKASEYNNVLMPGYTHLQRAQPVLLAHHLLAYVSMLDRDRERFEDCRARVNRSPLGAGALAGTSFPIDRNQVARLLGFEKTLENSIDAVSDRDVQIEFIAACAIVMMHLSRLSEELVLWSSHEWGFVEIGDAFTTGSSIMPQKKNPDMAELVRGKAGRVYGDLMALLTVMKGLPLAYNRDLQEDKEPLFDAADTAMDSLSISAAVIGSVRFRKDRFEKEMASDFLLATDLADYLVRKGLPFRKAHAIVGEIVRHCISRGITLQQLPLDEYRKRSTLFDRDIAGILTPQQSVAGKKSPGSTSPAETRKALRAWHKKLGRG